MSKNNDRAKAMQLYIDSGGDIPLVDIAEKLGRPAGTVRGWKSKDKWDDQLAIKSGTFQYKSERSSKRYKDKNSNEKKAKDKVEEEIFENNSLTDKQQLFCIYYLKYFNATKAYQKAYQCSYNVANVEGYRHLVKPSIKQEIERLKKARLEGIQLDSQAIIQKYIDIAFADITDFLSFGQKEITITDEKGRPLLDYQGKPMTRVVNYVDFKNDYEVDGTIIDEISLGQNGAKVKLQNKMKALERLESIFITGNIKNDILKNKLESEKIKTKMLQLELDGITGEDVDQEAIDSFIKATKPSPDDIKQLFEKGD